MSTPQGSGSNPPHGNQAGQPTEQASWGQPPPGGWGQQPGGNQGPPADADDERTERVDPRAWNQQVQPPPGQQPPQQPNPSYGGQQGWSGQQQPPQQGGYGGQPGYGGQQQPYGGQPSQQNPYAPPQQQGWGGGQPPGQPQPTQQGSPWSGQQQAPPTQQQWTGQQSWNPGPSGYAPLPDASSPAGKRSKVPFIIGGVIALLLAAAAVVLFWIPGLLLPKIFDEKAVAEGVTTVLTRDYGLPGVTGVTCPANTAVKTGDKFTCTATVDGDPQKVEIRILDEQGKYEVGRPTP